MKKIFVLLAALLAAAGVAAQNPTAYFMEGSTFRSQFNPAFAPLRGYVNFPVIGGTNLNVSGNLSVDKMLFPRDGFLVTFADNTVSAADALGNLKTNNLFGEDIRLNIIGFGAFTRNHKNFWSFDLNVRAYEENNLPYSLFEFVKQGKEGQIRDIGLTADAYAEAAFSYSFPLLNDKLYIGVRGKFLVGLARGRLNYDRFDVSLQEDRWAVEAAGSLDLAVPGTEVKGNKQTFGFDDLDFGYTKPAGYGFAVDLGATYDIFPFLQASLAVTDLGFISWDKGSTISGLSAKNMEFTGVEVIDGKTQPQPEFDMDVLEFERTEPESASRMLRASVNAGLEYKVWQHKIGIGLLYTARVWEYKTLHNITGSVNFHPVSWFTLTGSYSVIDNRGGAVGLALNLCPSWINFYLATDMLIAKHTPQWIPIKQSTMNVTFGLGFPIGRRSHRIAEYIR